MHNFNEKHPQVIENVGCRCKICRGSILKSQKRQDVDAIIHDRQAENHLQVMKRERCRYIGLKKSICNNEYQGIADTTVATKASATANIKSVQIQRLPQRHLQQRISEMCRYRRCQKSESFCLPIYFNHSTPKKQEKDYALQRIGVGHARRS